MEGDWTPTKTYLSQLTTYRGGSLIFFQDKIKYIKKENGGVSSARNCGISVSTGDIICFADADDYVSTNYFQELHNAFRYYDCDAVFFGYNRIESTKTFSCLPHLIYDNPELFMEQY